MNHGISRLLFIALCALWFALPTAAWAGDTAPPVPDQIAAHFVQKRTLPDFDQPLISQGEVHFSREKGLKWVVKKPYQYTFSFHGDKAYEILPDGTRKTLDPDKAPWLKTVRKVFLGMLSGDQSALEKHFKISTKDQDTGQQITLSPKSRAMAKVIKEITVTRLASGQPRHIVIDEVSGARLDIRLTPLNKGNGD